MQEEIMVKQINDVKVEESWSRGITRLTFHNWINYVVSEGGI